MHALLIPASLVLLVAACASPAVDDPTGQTSPSASPGRATPIQTASLDLESPTSTPAPTTEPEPTATGADAFAEMDTCTNADDGWTVQFPESWWTNTTFAHSSGEEVAACWMFSAAEFDATDARNPNQPASGAEIYLRLVPPPGIVGVSGEIASEEDVTVDGYPGRRVEWRGTESDTTMGAEERLLQYVVELPDDVEFMAFADSTRTDDYEAAVAVLDGMMERIDLGDR